MASINYTVHNKFSVIQCVCVCVCAWAYSMLDTLVNALHVLIL